MTNMKRRAFTLVEIMAASAIMTIIVLGVLSITTNILKTYNKASGQLQNYFDANIVGNIISDDLESIVVKRDGRAWLQVAYPTDVGILTGRSFHDTSPMRPPVLMFYASTSLRPRYTKENTNFDLTGKASESVMIPGSLCAIKYQLALKSPFMKSRGEAGDENQYNAFYGLYRAVIDPRSTVLENMGRDKQGYTENPDTETYRNALEVNVWNGTSSVVDELGEEVSGVNLKTWSLAPENLLCSNVVDFRITFAVMYENTTDKSQDAPKYKIAYIPAGTPLTIGPRILANEAYEITQSGGHMNVDTNSEEFRGGFITFADVSMTFLSDAGAKQMQGIMRGGKLTEDDFKRIVLQHGNTVVRRVKFMSQSID